ncbi:MAG: S8 family serine peptidase [Lachnospiraceae bacterium]|nr:S8 family serine peptidase [Lachnospiraceae bacterium]
MRNLKVRRLIAMIMTVITVGAQSPMTAMAGELTDDVTTAETVADEEETSDETAEAMEEAVSETADTEEKQVSDNTADTNEVSEPEAENDAPVEDVTAEAESVETDETETVSEGFALTEEQYAAKSAVKAHNGLEDFASFVEGVDYAANEVVLSADSEEYAEEVARAYGASVKSFGYGVAVLDLSASELSVGEAYAMGADEKVALPLVEPNYIIELDDPEITDFDAQASKKSNIIEWKKTQWEDFGRYDPLLDPADPNFQWWHQYVDSYGAWGVFENNYKPYLGSDIKVAVIDTGVTAGHEELSGHTEVKDIGCGTEDINGHGTHVAGIIGASIGNYVGGAGIAPGIQILGYKARHDQEGFTDAYISRAINAAATDGASVINMSLGGPGYSSTMDQAVQAAYSAGVTIVCAAGNESKNGFSYPAAFDNVISVGASEEGGNKTQFSNFGTWVDIMAPGANMRSTYKGSDNKTYYTAQGTSQASPVIAGACGLYMSACGKVTPDEMEGILKRSTVKCNTKDACTSGIINVAKMFDGDTTPPQIDMLGEDNETSICTAQSGAFETCGTTVKGSQYIKFTGKGFNGDEDGNSNTSYFVTVDGSNPDPHNYTTSSYYRDDIKTIRLNYSGSSSYRTNVGSLLRRYSDTIIETTTITVKAVAVTGRGVISGVTSMQVTVDPEVYHDVNINGYPDGYTFGQGASWQLSSSVYAGSRWSRYSTTSGVDQSVKWSIESNSGCGGTTISDTGLISVGASDSGSFTVKCESTAYTDAAYATMTFFVAKRALVSSVELTEDSMTALADEIVIREWGEVTPEIKLKMTLTDGTVLTSDLPYVSWSSSDWWIADGRRIDGKEVVYPRSKGSCVLTGTVQDGSNTKFTVNVRVRSLIYSFDLSGQREIAQGKTAKYKAVPLSHTQYQLLYGYYTYNKKLYKKYGPSDNKYTWSIKDYNGNSDTDIPGVTVKNGKVKVASSVAAGTTFSVAVTANEGTTAKAMNYIPVKVTGSANDIIITTTATDPAYAVKVNKKGSVTSVQLFIRDVSTSPVDESWIDLKAVASNGATVTWYRNNYNVDAGYLVDDPNTLRVSAYGYKANTTLTARVNDGTKKKAVVKVKVIVPVASMEITAKDLGTYAIGAEGADMLIPESGISMTTLASGCSTKLGVAFGDEYGTATIKKVKWEARAGYFDNGLFTEDPALSGMFKLKNGKLSFKNGFTTDFTMNKGVLVTATATDGTQLKAQKFVIATRKTTFIRFKQALQGGLLIFETDGTAMEFEIKTDNPNVACPQFYDAGRSENGNMLVAFTMVSPMNNRGQVGITITAKDGTNKKFSQRFNLQ